MDLALGDKIVEAVEQNDTQLVKELLQTGIMVW